MRVEILQWIMCGRYENLQESFDKICNKLGLPLQTLTHNNSSTHYAYLNYYDDELKNLVYNFLSARF